MLWHWFGLQGGGKSWGAVVFAYDFLIYKKYKVYANFYTEFGEILDISKFMNYEYKNCVLIFDEAYGIADAHNPTKADSIVSEVTMQTRKKHIEGFWLTQLQGDLYTRIRNNAHRRVECINSGTDEEPILNYLIRDNHDKLIYNPIQFDTQTVRSAYHLYNTEETIAPMRLNPNITRDKVIEIFNDSSNKKSFEVQMKAENPFFIKDLCDTAYDLIKQDKNDKAFRLLKIK